MAVRQGPRLSCGWQAGLVAGDGERKKESGRDWYEEEEKIVCLFFIGCKI